MELVFNRALLGKCLWHYATERVALLEVVQVKYAAYIGSNKVNGPYGAGVRRNIRKGWRSFSNYIRFEVGDGSKIRLWHDIWCSDRPLKVMILEMFRISCDKDASVGNSWQCVNDTSQWNPRLLDAKLLATCVYLIF